MPTLSPTTGSLPTHLIAELSPVEKNLAEAWWRGLPEPERTGLLASWDRRAESCAHSWVNGTDGPAHWETLSVEVHGLFIDDDEPPEEDEPWAHELYEYLVNHEAYVCDLFRWFHICTRHDTAATAIRSGRIPAAFLCPFSTCDCPMRTLLGQARGKSLRLTVKCQLTSRRGHGDAARESDSRYERPLTSENDSAR